jgi:hypothetical protein
MFARLMHYLATLTKGRIVLWCYAIWYIANVAQHLDPRPRLWLTSVGLSAIIGVALWISTSPSAKGSTRQNRWQVFRLFLMPFCVSSFAALVKDAGYVLIFPPTLRENAIGCGAIAAFLLLLAILRRRSS